MAEELDYRLEAASQEAFADALRRRPGVRGAACAGGVRPRSRQRMDGRHARSPADHRPWQPAGAEHARACCLVRFLFSSPARVGLLHADPHPGNFRLLPDGRLGVLDFGAVDRLPDGLPPIFGQLLWLMHNDGDIETVERALRANGFLRPGMTVDLDELRAFLAPLAEPSASENFAFSREWMRRRSHASHRRPARQHCPAV